MKFFYSFLVKVGICTKELYKNMKYNENYVRKEFCTYGKPAPGAESHYEFCCSFPQNAHTLHALESSIFNGFLGRLLCSSDLDLVTPLS